MTDDSPPSEHRGSRPIPDPTTLTTEQVLRVKEQLQREADSLKELLQSQMRSQHEFCDEQIKAIEERLCRSEDLRKEAKEDTRQAFNAALQAQKDAVAKAEASTTKQIESLTTAFQAGIAGVDRSISDLKDRVTIMEAAKTGAQEVTTERRQITTERRQGQAGIYAAIAAGSILFGTVFSVAVFFLATAGSS